MICEKISLYPGDEDVYLETYIADIREGYKRKAILVIPGGGYYTVCSDREGEPVAQAFLPYGYQAFVLHYSVRRTRTFPYQLIEASAAMKYIRDNADRYGIDRDKVFVVGFSAGGHLAASLATMWNRQEIYDAVPMEYGTNKPTGAMLIYPVISGDPTVAHKPSFRELLGTDTPSEEQLEEVSLENRVGPDTCPLYLVHTASDGAVNVKNSLRMADACATAKIPFELHIYPKGAHGMALANEITDGTAHWRDDPRLCKWVENAALWASLL